MSDNLNQVALDCVRKIEDILVQPHHGLAQRRARMQVAIRDAMKEVQSPVDCADLEGVDFEPAA